MRLADRIAIVAGGGQTPGETLGNGRATALRFAQEGAQVLVADRRLDSARDTVDRILAEGGRALACEGDVTDEQSCIGIVDRCMAEFGRVDILHNNVGRSEGDRAITEMSEAMWDELLDINLKSVFLMCKHTLPLMRAQKSGVIVNVSSTSAVCSRPMVGYSTAKAAINTLSRNLATQNAEYGIRVNVVLPGLMDTPMAIERRAREQNVSRDDVRESRHRQVPLNARMGSAWDVANAALFLASDEARYITGVVLPVDGGLSARVG
jgi:NAD(P)-dependent dehydrogenase (short-subunit alcohol dehydrogenase family)